MDLFLKRLLQILVIWQMVAPGAAICQNGFNKIIEIPNTLSLNFDDILYDHDQLIVRGNAYNDSLNLWGLFIAGLDTNGVVLWHNTIEDSSHHSHIISNTPCRVVKSTNNGYLAPSKFYNYGKSCLFILDSIGNEKYIQIYPKYGLTIFPKDVIQIGSNYFIAGSIQQENFKDDVFVIKTDSIGEQLWIKYYGSPAFSESFGDLLENPDSTFSISSSIYSDDYNDEPFGQGWRRPWIFTIDTSGQIIKQWMGQTNDTRTLGGGPMYRSDEGDWIIVSYEHKEVLSSGQTDLNSNPTITRLDSNYNLVWKKYLGNFTGIYDLIIDLEYDNRSQTIIAAGERVVSYAPWLSELEGWIIKLNMDGEILWSVSDTVISDPVNGVIHFLGGVEVAPTGSIYAAGYVTHSKPPQRDYGWIIKATADGCIDTICTTVSVEEQINHKDEQVRVYPNPFSDRVHFRIQHLRSQSILKVFGPDGKECYQTTISEGESTFNFDFPPGMYFYAITDDLGIFASGRIAVTPQ